MKTNSITTLKNQPTTKTFSIHSIRLTKIINEIAFSKEVPTEELNIIK